MKPYPNYKGNKLKEITPTAIALVTEGANRRKFCLFKSKDNTSKEGVSPMKKETALALVKSGTLSDDQMNLVIADVADADKAEVQKAIDGLKKSASTEIDVEKLAVAIADKIVKSQEAKLSEIAASLKATVTTLEKISGKPGDNNQDPELSDEEVTAALEKAAKEEEGK